MRRRKRVRNGRKAYFSGEKSHQVFSLVDSDYRGGPDFLPVLESLSLPVLMKVTVRPVERKVSSRLLGALTADRKSEMKYSRSMGDSERSRISRQISELEGMASRTGTGKSALVKVNSTFRISSAHPVKLREEGRIFTSLMSLLGFRVTPERYLTPSKLSTISSTFENVGPDYLMDTASVSSILPLPLSHRPKVGGFIAGFDEITEKPVLVDVFAKSSHNVLVFGETGSGKSYFSKILLMRQSVLRPNLRIVVVDPLNEYSCRLFDLSCREIEQSSEEDRNGEYSEDVLIFKPDSSPDSMNEEKMILQLRRIYGIMEEDPGREKIILIDEAHLLLSRKGTLEVLSRMIRHSRHYSTSVISITQNMDDLSSGRLSNVIAENSSSVFVFRTRSAGAYEAERFGFTGFPDFEPEGLAGGRNSPYSQCYFLENEVLRTLRILGNITEMQRIMGKK